MTATPEYPLLARSNDAPVVTPEQPVETPAAPEPEPEKENEQEEETTDEN